MPMRLSASGRCRAGERDPPETMVYPPSAPPPMTLWILSFRLRSRSFLELCRRIRTQMLTIRAARATTPTMPPAIAPLLVLPGSSNCGVAGGAGWTVTVTRAQVMCVQTSRAAELWEGSMVPDSVMVV